jgi:hypothetical protein
MAFGRISKQDLVDAGLDPDKLAEFQSKGVTKDDLTAMSTALETKLTTTVTDLIKNSFLDLEGKLRPVSRGNENNNNNNNNNREETPDEQTEFLTDPVNFINKKSGAVYGAAAIELKKMTRDLAWKEGMRTLKGMNNSTLRAEIEEEWKKYPAEKMAQFGTDPSLCLQQLHDMVLGKHHDEIMQDNNKKDGKFNLVHSGAGASAGNTGAVSNINNNDGKPVLTDAEKVQARKFGMTDEEWIKQGEDMEKEESERKGVLVGGNN